MPTLPKELRSKLEKAVLAARDEASEGADAALIALGVGDAARPTHLDADQAALRRRLRARGRQAGDVLRADDSQETGHLVQECAYEHWHRMLFARFLAENELLRHPDMGVAVSLEECEELAREEGLDLWELAARFAQHMLPGVFRNDDPVLHLRLPTEARNKLTALLNALPPEVFTADDSLGWTYQFWQTKRKKEVNASGVKIGADEISPVTQLFTEDYMVEFLLHNTLGAWHAARCAAVSSFKFSVSSCPTEDDARRAAALPPKDGLPGIDWTYLRFIRTDAEGGDSPLNTENLKLETEPAWKPAAGSFEGWPTRVSAITFLDPCMGSGHFPVFALPLLARLRMEEEGLSAAEAVAATLRDNIHGLEIDPRCCQIGAFNLALTAWKLAGYQTLPSLHIACCGLAPQAKKEDWIALAGDNDKLRRGMERLYKLFEQAPVLGSLINPRIGGGDLIEADYQELQPLLETAMSKEGDDETLHEMVVTAQGLAKAAELLAGRFILVATNVPFLKRGYQEQKMSDWIEAHYENGKANIATAMLMRSNELATAGGTVSLVIQQSWLYQTTQWRLREQMLESCYWNSLARLGPGAFDTIGGEVVNVALVTLTKSGTSNPVILGIDVYAEKGPDAKSLGIRRGSLVSLNQAAQSDNPQSTVIFPGGSDGSKLIGTFCDLGKGSVTGDSPHFIRQFWEQQLSSDWEPWLNTPEGSLFSGRHQVVWWQHDGYLVSQEKGVAIRGQNLWGKRGFLVGKTSFAAGIYCGEMFDDNTGVLAPKSESEIAALLCFGSSSDFAEAIRDVDQELKVTIGNFGKIAIDLAHWQKVAAEKYPNGLPKPHSDDPTQWLFNGHPKVAEASSLSSNEKGKSLEGSSTLHVAVARLLGYRWPRQTGSSFPDCPALEPDGLGKFADDDGIVCLTSIHGEENAADRVRQLLRAALGAFDEHALIAAAGKKGSKSKTLEDWLRDEFFAQHGDLFHKRPFIWHLWDGRKDGFHALVNYHQLAAPDGGGRRTLESLTYGYLGDWITRQKHALDAGEEGADDRHAAALELKGQLEKILAGEPPYDLFIRWKPLHQQPIGWEPDLNDGVRLNIRPFLATDLSRGRKGAGLLHSKLTIHWKKDRGKEPVREKEDFPWFWNWDEETENFQGIGAESDGNRWNALHYTTDSKQAARDRYTEQEGDSS